MSRMRFRQLARMLSIQRVLLKHGLDEIVWRTQTEDFWVNFKFGSIFLTFLFMATQLPMIKRHMLPDPVDSETKGAAGE